MRGPSPSSRLHLLPGPERGVAGPDNHRSSLPAQRPPSDHLRHQFSVGVFNILSMTSRSSGALRATSLNPNFSSASKSDVGEAPASTSRRTSGGRMTPATMANNAIVAHVEYS